jgi:hypothetical protein
MTNKSIEDFGRRDINFHNPKVVEVLPEYFQADNPQLITLLNSYQDFMDSDGSINDELRNVLKSRDIGSVSLDFLDFILDETGRGISGDQFEDPRTIARNFPSFFRYKGSKFSSVAFFRALYGEEVEISYPKDNLFIVGESEIGPESLRFMQDGKLYQTLSILIKSSRPISQWKTLYKKYVHPAGFYLGGEVLAEGIVSLDLNAMPSAIPDTSAGQITLSSETVVAFDAVSDPLTLLITSPDSDTIYRVNSNKTMDKYDSATLADAATQYNSVFAIGDANGAVFSDSVDSTGVDWTNTIETFDQSDYD